MGGKRFYLVFPEGRGILGGWVKLVEKLRSLGVVTLGEVKVGYGYVGDKAGRIGDDQGEVEEEKRSFAEVTKAKVGRLRDVVWLQLGDRDLRSRDEQLGLCLVGRWGGTTPLVPKLALLRRWGVHLWNLKRGVSFSNLGGGLFLAEFQDAVEVERVLRKGIRYFEDKVFHIER